MSVISARAIMKVCVDMVGGEQFAFYDDDVILDQDGQTIDLHQIASTLAAPNGLISWQTSAERKDEDNEEPWQEKQAARVARAYVYARGVQSVLVIYDEEAEGDE